jgi:hypothetical protein
MISQKNPTNNYKNRKSISDGINNDLFKCALQHFLNRHYEEVIASSLACPVGPRYIALARTAQKTPLPRIPPLLSDVLSGLLPSLGPVIVDAGACFGCHENLCTGRCLATNNFSGSAIPAFSRHVTT